MNQEYVDLIFADIIDYLSEVGRVEDFNQAHATFDLAFKHAAQIRGRPYGEQHAAAGQSLFFTPFSADSPWWHFSIEVLAFYGHYAVFDRTGQYAIYRQNGERFGPLRFASPGNCDLERLEHHSAADLISNIVGFHHRILPQTNLSMDFFDYRPKNKNHISRLIASLSKGFNVKHHRG